MDQTIEPGVIRPPAVAGRFYTQDPQTLASDVRSMLDSVSPPSLPRPIKALIAPHAGYVYSGPIAASVYALLIPQAASIRRVVLLGPSHQVPIRGLAVADTEVFATPLGQVKLDRAAIDAADQLAQVFKHNLPHAHEHSLEVQLPFLQQILPDFTLVPFTVGQANPQEVAEVIELLWGGDETIIIISSDLSHYHPYDDAVSRDRDTVNAISGLQMLQNYEQACGAVPINGLIEVARRRGLQPHLLDLRNSGDTAGDKSRVVGYASFAFTEKPATPAQTDLAQLGAALLSRARNSITRALDPEASLLAEPDHPALHAQGASFVTLTQQSRLRGCIGSLQAHRLLAEDVCANANAAAFHDPRFTPLTLAEWPDIRVEVSLLSAPQAMQFVDQADAIRQIRPGIDGMIFSCQGKHGTFLPQVWESLPKVEDFFANLKQKAGFAPDFWSPEVRLFRYEVLKWKE